MDVRLLLRFLLCLVSTAAAFGQTDPICPSRRYQLRLSNGINYCYLYVASPLSYAAANRSCVRDGAILLSILSEEENTYIRDNFFTVNNNQEFWIGLNDILEEGTFRWENSSGSTGDASQPLPYTGWSSDYPNDNRESQDCVKFSSDGWRVHNYPCGSSELPYICKSNTCDSEDGENCIDSVTTVPPAPLVSPGGISAIVIVVIVVIAVLTILVIMVCLWKFKNDIFNRFFCGCCGGDRSKVRNLQQENQRLRQQLSQHRLSVSGRMPPGQFTNALSGVPDGRGGMLPAIKQPISPMDDRPAPFLSSPVGAGPPPLSIQRQTTAPGPLIGGRPPLTTPSGPLPRSVFTGSTPIRPIRQSAPMFSGGAPPTLPQISKPGSSNGPKAGPVAMAAVLKEEEEEETESSGDSEEEEGAGPNPEGAGSKQDDDDKDSQQE